MGKVTAYRVSHPGRMIWRNCGRFNPYRVKLPVFRPFIRAPTGTGTEESCTHSTAFFSCCA